MKQVITTADKKQHSIETAKNVIKYLKSIFSSFKKDDIKSTTPLPNINLFSEQTEHYWLSIEHLEEPDLPEIPYILKPYVNLDSLRTSEPYCDLYAAAVDEQIDQSYIESVWKKYITDQWQPWYDRYQEWKQNDRLYKKLYGIYKNIERNDVYEVFFAIGQVVYKTGNRNQREYLLLQKAVIEPIHEDSVIYIKPHDDGDIIINTKLRYSDDFFTVDPAIEASIRNEITCAGNIIADIKYLDKWLKTILNALSPSNQFLRNKDVPRSIEENKLYLTYSPALLLKEKGLDKLLSALDSIEEHVNDGVMPPLFSKLLALDNANKTKIDYNYDNDIWFPKPSNAEQDQIAEKLQTSCGVIVQGPPGTGKSHTITNMISYLLSQGKKVLVTAEKPVPLQVLYKQLPEDIRPLCISLLGSNNEKELLRNSISTMLQKVNSFDYKATCRKIDDLEKALRKTKSKIRTLNQHIIETRRLEAEGGLELPHGYSGNITEVANAITAQNKEFEWFEDTERHLSSSDIDKDLLVDIVSKIIDLNIQREDITSKIRIDDIIKPDDFKELLKKISNVKNDISDLKIYKDNKYYEILKQSMLLPDMSKHCYSIKKAFDSLGIVSISRKSSLELKDLLRMLSETADYVSGNNYVDLEAKLVYPENPRFITDLDELLLYMSTGNPLRYFGLFTPKFVKQRQYVMASTINGIVCDNVEMLAKLKDTLIVRKALNDAINNIQNLFGIQINLNTYTSKVEVLNAFIDIINALLFLDKQYIKFGSSINSEDIENIINTVKYIERESRLIDLESQRCSMRDKISSYLEEGYHLLYCGLSEAFARNDVDKYEKIYNELSRLSKAKTEYFALMTKLTPIKKLIPKTISNFEYEIGDKVWLERFSKIDKAINWARASLWLKKQTAKSDINKINRQVEILQREVYDITAKLIAHKAWLYCYENMDEVTKQHMRKWENAINKYGKGKGLWAHKWQKNAQKHLEYCRNAVQAWIMPLEKVWATIKPKPEMFDVIIVDEASQIGLAGLPLFYITKQIIIVGDDEQTSVASSKKRADTNHLLQKYIPETISDYFDIEYSLFETGRSLFANNMVILREHFRSMPEIIEFSNKLCYTGKMSLIPLRQYSSDRLEPLKDVYVENGYTEGRNYNIINRNEAESIVNTIAGMCKDKRYNNKSIGVVVLHQGRTNQISYIQNLINERISQKDIVKHDILCGSPREFQGDERDVILLSLVVAPPTPKALTSRTDKQRFNVAVSRAKDQIWLFRSVNLHDLKPSDIRYELVKHFTQRTAPLVVGGDIDYDELRIKATRADRRSEPAPKPFDSWFEVDVALAIQNMGYRVIPQYPIGEYRIDLVIEGQNAKLAVECDGEAWHGPDAYEHDIYRQRQLERCGWRFFRIKDYEYNANPDFVMSNLRSVLDEMRISPTP